jgi:site-specific recombinase XerD
MITLQNYLLRAGVSSFQNTLYEQRLNNFTKSYPNKRIYTPDDIAQYCNGSKSVNDQMKVLEKYLRLNFKIVQKAQPTTQQNRNVINLIKVFLQYMNRINYAKQTIAHYNENLKIFAKFIKSIDINTIDEIDRNVIQAFKERLYRTKNSKGKLYEVNSQSKILSRTKLFFQYLVRDEYIFINPCLSMTFPRERKKISRNMLTRNEIENLLTIIPTDTVYGFIDRTIFELFYATGIRIGEFLNLETKHVNFDDGLITIYEGKNNHSHPISI